MMSKNNTKHIMTITTHHEVVSEISGEMKYQTMFSS